MIKMLSYGMIFISESREVCAQFIDNKNINIFVIENGHHHLEF